jgi:hypothetical protein
MAIIGVIGISVSDLGRRTANFADALADFVDNSPGLHRILP